MLTETGQGRQRNTCIPDMILNEQSQKKAECFTDVKSANEFPNRKKKNLRNSVTLFTC